MTYLGGFTLRSVYIFSFLFLFRYLDGIENDLISEMNKNIAEGVPTTTLKIMDIIPKLCVSFHVLVSVVKMLTDGTTNPIAEEIDLPIVQDIKEFVEHLEEQNHLFKQVYIDF